ncbi:MAG: VWA domain-containing protein [Bacteroidia bacterium]
MDILRFEDITYLYGLLAIPLLLGLFLLFMLWRRRAIARFGDKKLVQRLAPEASTGLHIIKIILVLLAGTFLVLGLANLQIGNKLKEVELQGVDVVIALDLSRSMNATDVMPSRLDLARNYISKLLDRLQNDRVALIVFAGNAYVQMPLTSDLGAAQLFLSSLQTDIIPSQGTAISEALALAGKSFSGEEVRNKVIIVVSDGENHEGDAIEEAGKLEEQGARVYTVGLGSANGSPVPASPGSSTFLRDKNQNIIFSKLNEEMLVEIADAGGGEYYRLTNAQEEVDAMLTSINEQEKNTRETQVFADYEDQFQFFLAAALLFLVAEFFVPLRRLKPKTSGN